MKPLLLICFAAFTAAVTVVSGTAIIDHELQKRFLPGLGGGGGGTQNIMVSFTQGIQTVIDQVNRMNFSSTNEKRTVLTNMQQTFTNGIQQPLQSFLSGVGVNYKSFWINNKMIVPNVNSGLVQAISNIPGIAKIEPEPQARLDFPIEGEENIEDMEYGNITRVGRQSGSLAWGVQKIRADQVWQSFKGRGIVVAGIDTGVRYTHESLRGRWRQNYGWYDPYEETSTPNDGNGHGTHTMGTIAGTNGVGVAPEATWIACKGCSARTCGGNELFACGQWVQCPTKPDGTAQNCNMAPDVVSNSWGSSGGQRWFDDIVKSWHAAEIIPVFSIGNSGPECNTAGSPGDGERLIAVGSTDNTNRNTGKESISSFSSLGPSKAKGVEFKPDIAAPGGQVRSAWHTGDRTYNTISGTSMACPHVSGVVALILQKKPKLPYNDVYTAITKTAVKDTLDLANAKTCGGKSGSRLPNNVFGHGRIDALNSVNAA